MQGVFCNERPRVKRRILPASAWFRSGGRQDKKRVFGRECQNSGASGCDSQTLDGRSAAEQTEIYCRTLVQLSKMPLGGTGITIGFPAAAAGEVAARIFDKAHHIVERIAQKYADLMGEISLAAEPAGQLPQKRRVVVRLLRQSVAFLIVGTVANNGNLLLNIGPKADGTIPEEQVRRLKILGAWLKVNHDGIYGTRCSDRESELLENGIELHYTQKDGNLNVFADHLKEGANEFLIKGYHGALRPFDPAVKVETEDTAEGLLVKIPEYKEDMYVVGLTNRF